MVLVGLFVDWAALQWVIGICGAGFDGCIQVFRCMGTWIHLVNQYSALTLDQQL